MPKLKESNRVIKNMAKQMLSGNVLTGLAILFILHISSAVPSALIDIFAPESTLIIGLYNAYVLLITGPLKLGIAIFFLSCVRGQSTGINSVGYGFDYFSKAAVLYINITFRVMIWGMLFVIPGILAFIKYSQAFFVLADNPQKSVYACLQESKYIMRNNVGRYITLYIGFIPYYFLVEIPRFLATKSAVDTFIANKIFDTETYIQAMQLVAQGASKSPYAYLSLVLGVIIDVFRLMALAVFFELASGKLVIEHENNYGYTE